MEEKRVLPSKEVKPDDPMELVGVTLPGDADEQMVETFVEEFIRMGKSDKALWQLFKSPVYAATHRIYKERGEAFVQDAITRVRSRFGYWRLSDE